MNWKDVYSSRRRYLKTVSIWSLLSLIALVATLGMFGEMRKTGKIVVRGVTLSDNAAIGYICAIFFVSVIAFLYASFIGLFGLWYFKSANGTKENLTPEFWICTKCRNTFAGYSVANTKCTQCGGNLENLDGFFERHPHLK